MRIFRPITEPHRTTTVTEDCFTHSNKLRYAMFFRTIFCQVSNAIITSFFLTES